MMNKTQVLYLGWLVLGGMQLLVDTGCGQSAVATDHLFSSTSPTAPSSERSGEAPASAVQMPVRISRTFFENTLSGEVRLQSPGGGSGSTVQSPIAWSELAPTESVPSPTDATGAVLADFRDHQGCATFQDPGTAGLTLCFNMMGDVSNIGLNDKEMKASGMGALIDRQLGLGCQDAEWSVRFIGASRTQAGSPQGFTVSFSATPVAPNQACNSGNPVQVDLSLRQT